MSYKSRSLFSIIESINTEIVLPHIQRPFVWEIDQMGRLFDSLMRNYPIQTLLFWKTKEGIKSRRFMENIESEVDLHDFYDDGKSQEGVTKVFVLDGQQRLQSLYCLFNGTVKDEKTKVKLEAYVDITSGDVDDESGLIFKVIFHPVGQAQNLPLFRIRDLLGKYNGKNAEDVADEINTTLDSNDDSDMIHQKKRERQVRRNIGQIFSILREDKHFWIEELDGVSNTIPYNQILDIFVRVNSGGTKLQPSDLMFAAMKEMSGEIEQQVEEMAELLQIGDITFEVDFVLKCLVLAHGKGAEVSPKKFSGVEGKDLIQKIEENWEKCHKAFQSLRDFIAQELKLYSPKVIRSYNSFIPIFEYLYHNPSPDPTDKQRLKAYYYRAQMFYWFSSQTDGILDVLHNNYLKNVAGKPFPLKEISEYFKTSRKAMIELTDNHILNHKLRHIFLNLIYVETNSTSPFNVKLKYNEPHIDHIYPKSKLFKLGLSAEEVNHIGNYRFVGEIDNIRKRAENPDSFFGRLHTSGVDISRHLLVDTYSINPSELKMNVKAYREFRDNRFAEVSKIAKKVVNYE
jgi:hypothetical protein